MGRDAELAGSIPWRRRSATARWTCGSPTWSSVRLTVTPTVRFTANATAEGKFKASKELVDKKMTPLPSNVPSLILTPKLSISFEITGEIVATAEVEYSYSTTWGTECVSPCDSLSDWRRVATGAKANGDASITAESFVGGSVKASIPSRVSVEASWLLPMFDFASMFLELTPFVTGTAVKEESWPFCLLAKVESGLDGEIGVDAFGLEGPSFAGSSAEAFYALGESYRSLSFGSQQPALA